MTFETAKERLTECRTEQEVDDNVDGRVERFYYVAEMYDVEPPSHLTTVCQLVREHQLNYLE